MKKILLIFVFILVSVWSLVSPFSVARIYAQTPTTDPTQQLNAGEPPDGTWLSDNEVTFAGKNAARSKDLFNWVLVNYQWSTRDDTLIAFWAKIRNVVFVFLIIVVMVSAFLMIITGGQSLTAMQFIRKFLIVVILITFSFAFIRVLYQIIDIIQSFFIKNPDGQIISSKDLLNISFDYVSFTGYRKYGAQYNEAAFISLLLTKITAATYFVMAGVLIVRKVILWFFITVSPIYPVLLLYFPIRNTAKIWIGEFFRWLLYAPLFAIFLSGLVVLWRDNINVLPFNFYANGTKPIVFPTAINILLGGPGQTLAIDNNINYTDTFAEYIVALIMLWVVIFLPFLLLRIFLDYLSTVSFNNNAAWKYIVNNANKVMPNNDFFVSNKSPKQPPPVAPVPPSYHPAGVAMQLPQIKTGDARQIPVPQSSGAAKGIARPVYQTASTATQQPSTTNIYNQSTQTIQNTKNMPVYKSQQTSIATSQLANIAVPTMRDVARLETSRLSTQLSSHQEISKVNETLQKIANPQSITNPVERQQYNTIREKLTQASQQGEPLATSILNAANNSTRTDSQTTISSMTQQATTQVQQSLQKLANPQSITNVTERQQITQLKEKLIEQSKQGDLYATTILNATTNNSQVNQQMLQQLAKPEAITNTTVRQQVTTLKEKLVQASKQGDQVATTILNAVNNIAHISNNTTSQQNISHVTQESTTQVQQVMEKLANPQAVTNTTERQQITTLKEKLTEQSQAGNSYATTMLNTINNLSKQSSEQNTTQIQQIVQKLAHPEAVTDTTERQQITQLKQALTQEKEQGNPVATSILSAVENVQNAQTQQTTVLPTTNQVQTVNLEDYEEVKKTWTENYQKADIPKTLDNPDRTRQQWIQEDLSKTTHAIDMLTSQDQKNVQEGMKEVSALLPFLLLGGFSQTEVVAYLQAKKHAAEEVMAQTKQSAAQEEDTLLDATQRATHTQRTMHMDAPETHTTVITTNNNDDDDDSSPLSQIATTSNIMTTNTTQPVLKSQNKSAQILQLINFSIPTMRNVAQYEAANVSANHPVRSQVDQMHDMIQKLANPQAITDEKERETYIEMKQQLLQAKEQGDPLAASIITTVQSITPAAQPGQQPVVTAAALPKENQVQTVNLEDYEEVRNTWKENYQNLEVPKSLDKPDRTRREWIQEDVTKTTNAISLLNSDDPQKKKEGMQLVAELLPFLLLGGFSETEVIAYLQAKQHAGEEVLKDETAKQETEEETMVDKDEKREEDHKDGDKKMEIVEEEQKKDQQG